MSDLVYTCDACEDAGSAFAWRDTRALRGLVTIARATPAAILVENICSHAVSVKAGSVLWLGPSKLWDYALKHFQPSAPVPADALVKAYGEGWESSGTLAQLVKLPGRDIVITAMDRGLVAVASGDVRWVGPRATWAAARLPYLRAALSRAS